MVQSEINFTGGDLGQAVRDSLNLEDEGRVGDK